MTSRDIWVLSDTHWAHKNILKFTDSKGNLIRGSRFKDIEEHDWYMVERWNSVVKPQDKVYHLGDVYMGAKKDYIENIFRHLNGHKRLILGNHDNGKDQTLQRYFEKIDVWRKFPEFGLLLTHVPVHDSTLKEARFGVHTLNVHGHIHQNPSPDGPYQCVSMEQLQDYTPIHIEELRII